MLTLLQFATLFNIFGCALVLLMSVLTLRLRPEPFFRWWVVSYAWGVATTIAITAEALIARSAVSLVLINVPLVLAAYYQARMGFVLLDRPFPTWRVRALLATLFAGILATYAAKGLDAAMVPGAASIMVAFLWMGGVMIHVGRTPAHAGMGWIGVPVLIQGAWLSTYPLLDGTPYFWVGFGIAAMLAVGVGIGMAMYVLFRTTHQLEAQNASLQAAEQSLREADRLQREFLNAASHELRTPLTTITGYAEFLEEAVAGPLTSRQAEYVGQIQRGAGRLSRLVDDMLDFAVLESGQFALAPQAADLGAIARAELEGLRPLARERQVRLELDLPAEPLPVRVDPLRLGQVITNLVGNGLKFTPAGGAVRVTARALGGTVRVEVIDEGIGIAPEHVPHLFTKFFRVDPSSTRASGGAGLGLAISRALVEAHGGRIGVASTPGKGSTFWFELPRA